MTRAAKRDLKREEKGKARHASRRVLVLVFGESAHDRGAICDLTVGIRPDFAGSVEPRRAPLVLIKNARPEKGRSNAEDIAKLAQQESAARDVVAVLAHQDCDAVEPAHVAAARKIENALEAAGCPGTPIGVTPAWEIEAWWLVFPDAVATLVEGWREPNNWIGKDVGQVENAKEELMKAVLPTKGQRTTRKYHESDSIEVARSIVKQKLLASFDEDHRMTHGKGVAIARTRSLSFGAFRRKVLALPRVEGGHRAKSATSKDG